MKLHNSLSPVARWGATAAIALLGCAAAPAANSQTLLTYFNFNDSGVANQQPATAAALTSDAPGLQTTTITTNFNAPATNVRVGAGTTVNQHPADLTGAGQGLTLRQGAAPGNNGNYIQFSVSTVGFTDVSLSYATIRTSEGFTTQTLSYSTDGGITFTTFGSFSPTTTGFTTALFDLSAVNSIENQLSVTFRITFSGASNPSGTNTIDNLQVNGIPVVPVPEPATVVGGLLGVAGLCFNQRRRLSRAIRPHLTS